MLDSNSDNKNYKIINYSIDYSNSDKIIIKIIEIKKSTIKSTINNKIVR